MLKKRKIINGQNFYFKKKGTISLLGTLMYLIFSYLVHALIYKSLPEEKLKISFKLGMVIFFLFQTFIEDPGNLPKLRKRKNLIIYRNPRKMPLFKKINLNRNKVHLKFCLTCGIWRAPRSSHCTPCNHCIMEFDHHCPWIGTCVGLRNYRSFLIFITILFLYLISLFKDIKGEFFGQHQRKKDGENTPSWGEKKLSHLFVLFFFLVFTIMGILFTGALFCFHFYLGITGKTTSELFKFPNKKMGNRDAHQEIFSRLCRGRPPSLTIMYLPFPPTFFDLTKRKTVIKMS